MDFPDIPLFISISASFLLGASVGSFFVTWTDRYDSGKSTIGIDWKHLRVTKCPKSHCFNCGHFLSPRDMVPLLSFVWKKGKCSYCGGKIPSTYPLVEGLIGVIFSLISIYSFLSVLVFIFIWCVIQGILTRKGRER